MNIDYKFDLDQKVKTTLDEVVIVTMLGFDDGGKQYYCKGKSNSSWYKEKELVLVQ